MRECVSTHPFSVDDPRNTDNAWMETCAVAYWCPGALRIRLHAGDDAVDAKWLDVKDIDADSFYANHFELVMKGIEAYKGFKSS